MLGRKWVFVTKGGDIPCKARPPNRYINTPQDIKMAKKVYNDMGPGIIESHSQKTPDDISEHQYLNMLEK